MGHGAALVAGFLGIIGGSAIVTGGAAVTTTGVLAPAGAVALVGGAAVATAGVAVEASATANITAGDPNIQFSTAQGSGGSERGTETVDDILEGAKPGRSTKGKTTQYEKPGAFDQTFEDFDSLNPSNVKDISTKYGPGKTGTLPDGRIVTARPGSSDGRPTLEIRSPNGRGIEIRYGE